MTPATVRTSTLHVTDHVAHPGDSSIRLEVRDVVWCADLHAWHVWVHELGTGNPLPFYCLEVTPQHRWARLALAVAR